MQRIDRLQAERDKVWAFMKKHDHHPMFGGGIMWQIRLERMQRLDAMIARLKARLVRQE